MKKVYLILLLICSIANAQDYQFIEQSKNLPTEASAMELSKELALTSKVELRLYKSKEITKQKKFKVVYVPVTVKDEDIENYNVASADQKNFFTFLFNIDSESKYRLLEVQSDYENVYPLWNKYYNANSERLNEPAKNIRASIQKQGDYGTIYN